MLYEFLVKYPKNDIKQLNTQFYGLEMNHIKYAIGDNLGDNQNRKTCLDYLACSDLNIGCNIRNDLLSLSLTTSDIFKLNHKLVDIGSAFNPRLDERVQFGLKYYVYLRFRLSNFQKNEQSPTVDAFLTL